MPPRKLKPVAEQPERERAPDLRDAVRSAVDAMTWLTASDEAMRTLALRQAEEIEKAIDRAEELRALQTEFAGEPSMFKRLQKLEAMCEVTKAVGWLGPQLQGVLRDLGGAPAARKALQPDKPIGGRLAQLRDAEGQHDS
jgi:isopropylmalate/homocitrate/citramalate synthase